MTLKVSKRRPLVAQSEIRNMTLECARVNGVNLAQGVCDLPVPRAVMDGVTEAMADGYNIYTRFDGLPRLRRAVAAKQKRYAGMDVDPEAQVVVSAGATGAFYAACLALLDAGDEVVVFEPYYGYHIVTMVSLGIKPVYVTLEPPAWEFSAGDLEKAVSSKTPRPDPEHPVATRRARSSPARTWPVIADFAEAHDLFVFTDEIYEPLRVRRQGARGPGHPAGHGEADHHHLPACPRFSRSRAGGWATPSATRSGPCPSAISTTWCTCAPPPRSRSARPGGLRSWGRTTTNPVSDDHQRKRDLFCDHPCARPGSTRTCPRGAYYTLADVTSLPGTTSKERALYLLEKTGVACVPGSAFYSGPVGETLARFCFAKEMDVLEDAMDRLRGLVK